MVYNIVYYAVFQQSNLCNDTDFFTNFQNVLDKLLPLLYNADSG